jgi:hypothetical protein
MHRASFHSCGKWRRVLQMICVRMIYARMIYARMIYALVPFALDLSVQISS